MKRFSVVVASVLTAGIAGFGGGVANATPAGSGAAAGSMAAVDLMKDCLVSGGTTRGCSYFNPDNNLFRVCDLSADGRYTIGRVSLNGVALYEDTIKVDNACYPFDDQFVPAGHGDKVCIHTGVEGLGWTTAECRIQ